MGCSSRVNLDQYSTRELRQVKLHDLCKGYFHRPRKAVREELVRRNAIPERAWSLVRKKLVSRGMTVCAVMASWGSPNRTLEQTKSDIDQKLIYIRNQKRFEVSTRNNRVIEINRYERNFLD